MAAVVSSLARLAAKFLRPQSSGCQNAPKRLYAVYTETGALKEMPPETRFGTLKALATVIPFLAAGATLSKKGAAFLEENDIFVPDDDDD